MNSVSNTLSRWHKIAERITSRLKALQQEINSSVVYSADAATLVTLKDGIVANANAAITTKFSNYLKLSVALTDIKVGIAKANASAGVSAILIEIEGERRVIQGFEGIISSLENTVQIDKCVEIAAKSAPDEGTSSRLLRQPTLSARLIADNSFEKIKADSANSRRKLEALTDKLSDANATRIVIELSEFVCDELGIS